MKTVVLGAGPPHRGDTPAPLAPTQLGSSVLEWAIEAMDAQTDQVTFVAGYFADAVRDHNPNLSIVENTKCFETGSGASLLVAPLHNHHPILVSYGDILYRAWLVERLRAARAPIAIAWDSAWCTRYAGRSDEDPLWSQCRHNTDSEGIMALRQPLSHAFVNYPGSPAEKPLTANDHLPHL